MDSSTQTASGLADRLTGLPLKWRTAGIVTVGLLQAFSFPPFGASQLLPICVALFLILINGLEIKWAFRLGVLYGVAWFAVDVHWFANIFGTAAISLWAIMAFFPGLFAALFVWMRSRIPRAPFWLLAALLWTGVEYYRSEPFVLNFGWLGLGYASVNDHLLARIASVLGCYGITFVIVCCAALIAQALLLGGRHRYTAAAIAYTGFLTLGAIPLPGSSVSNPMRVRLVQAPSEDDELQFRLSRMVPSQPVDVIVWPEYSFVGDGMWMRKTKQKLDDLVHENNAYLLFGGEDVFNPASRNGYRNTAFLLDPTGTIVGKHVKNHTVHFFNDGVPGTTATAIQTRLGRLGVGICFDMDYPDIARRLTEDGAEALLIPNNDPPNWGPIQRIQHRSMFQMRALECGRWLARADVAGGTSIAMPTGVELVRAKSTGPEKLEASISRLSYRNLFIRGGWRFGPACCLLTIAMWVFAIVKGVRDKSGRSCTNLR